MNKKVYAGTNIFLRYLTSEPAEQAQKVTGFFNKVESGEYILFVCDFVISELVYVLEKVFELDKKELCEKIKILMLRKNIVLENTQVIFSALDCYRDLNVDFTDAYIYCHSARNNANSFFTFDKHFNKFSDIEIIED